MRVTVQMSTHCRYPNFLERDAHQEQRGVSLTMAVGTSALQMRWLDRGLRELFTQVNPAQALQHRLASVNQAPV